MLLPKKTENINLMNMKIKGEEEKKMTRWRGESADNDDMIYMLWR
jgi:hypothetical protein